MELRQLYKSTGICAVVLAVIIVAYYVIFVSANGFMGMSVAPPTPEKIIEMAQVRGNQINANLDLISYFFWIPTLVGMFVILRGRTPARACIGGAFAAFAVVCYFASSAMGAFVLEQARGTVTEALKERLSVLYAMSYSFMMIGMFAANLSYLLWGFAFRAEAGLSKVVGYLLLIQVALFIVVFGVAAGGQDFLFNVGFLLANLNFAATNLAVGALLCKASKAS